MTSNLIIYHKDKNCYSENRITWDDNESIPSRGSTQPFTDSELEQPHVLELIANHLSPSKKYDEAYINSYCTCFANRFARLRRKLVDMGKLTRENGYCERKL